MHPLLWITQTAHRLQHSERLLLVLQLLMMLVLGRWTLRLRRPRCWLLLQRQLPPVLLLLLLL
jgi:hypothetical protein